MLYGNVYKCEFMIFNNIYYDVHTYILSIYLRLLLLLPFMVYNIFDEEVIMWLNLKEKYL